MFVGEIDRRADSIDAFVPGSVVSPMLQPPPRSGNELVAIASTTPGMLRSIARSSSIIERMSVSGTNAMLVIVRMFASSTPLSRAMFELRSWMMAIALTMIAIVTAICSAISA